MPKYTQEEIDEKTADVVIDIIEILEYHYPETFAQIIHMIKE